MPGFFRVVTAYEKRDSAAKGSVFLSTHFPCAVYVRVESSLPKFEIKII